MVKFFYALFFVCTIVSSLTAQERALLYIGPDGKQEAIPLGKHERTQDAISRFEKIIEAQNSNASAGTIDSLKYYPGTAIDVAGALNTNFGWYHQDIAMQWYTPEASGVVKEFWWRNFNSRGNINKGTIRAWYADPKLANLPPNATKYLGYYKDPTDGDGLVTPFKPTTGDQWFYGNGLPDSAAWRFDPLGTEAPWLPGGLQVTLDSGKWQGIKLEDFGDTMMFSLGQLFGFTLSNDTKISDMPIPDDKRMEILSWPNANPAPFHSYKWYEVGRAVLSGTPPTRDAGWHLRGDYEWGMFVVVDYCGDRPPKFSISKLGTTLKTSSRNINVSFEYSGGCFPPNDEVDFIYLKYKTAAASAYDSVLMFTNNNRDFFHEIPGYDGGNKVFYYAEATTKQNKKFTSALGSYILYKKNNPNLLLYNNASFSEGNARIFYLGGTNAAIPGFDFWSTPADGVGELGDALALYNHVILGDGAFPARDVYPAIEAWLKTGTSFNVKNLFFTSQDYGCVVDANCAEITFSAGQWQYDILGIEKLGPQDVLGGVAAQVQRPLVLIPQSDDLTDYLIKYNTDSSTTIYYHPYFELGFSSYPDALTPKSGAKALFKSHDGTQTFGVWNSTSSTNTAFFAFDAGYSLQFRGDTTVAPSADPKYRRVNSIKALANNFNRPIDDISKTLNQELTFALAQNYPNPFNPSTTIEFSLPEKQNMQISIFNILGQKVTTLLNEEKEAGKHLAMWNAQQFASGIYFMKMSAGSFTSVKKMVLMK